jgi:phosphoserine aminotransferase
MISFYPGPSKLYPQLEQYLTDAYRSGLLSVNHRSPAFMQLLEQTVARLRHKLAIPADYEIYFTSSATECWEVVAQSLVARRSGHLYNGAFGQKWQEYTGRLVPEAVGLEFGLNELPSAGRVAERLEGAEVLCLTHSETSNGTMLPMAWLSELRQQTDQLLAVDATSSMAGVELDWPAADVWYASVQKCFGLPAGLGVLVVAPRAVERARQLNERRHYNSLLYLRDNFLKYQSPHTPNTLGLYLLGRVMEQVPPIADVAARTEARAADWYAFLEAEGYQPLVAEPAVRSATVVAVATEPAPLKSLKEAALAAGLVLGNGYGSWKDSTFRIANFPALTDAEIDALRTFLRTHRPRC